MKSWRLTQKSKNVKLYTWAGVAKGSPEKQHATLGLCTRSSKVIIPAISNFPKTYDCLLLSNPFEPNMYIITGECRSDVIHQKEYL